MMGYIRGILVLFVLMTLLLYLVPGENFRKYIRFFTELVLTIGVLMPVLSLICDSDEFLAMIEYEEFSGSLSELSRDMQRMEYIQNDYYIEEYETAIEGDVARMAEDYGYTVQEADVHMTEDYTLDAIRLLVTGKSSDGIVIGKIILEDNAAKEGSTGLSKSLKKELAEYYQMEESQIEIQDLGAD